VAASAEYLSFPESASAHRQPYFDIQHYSGCGYESFNHRHGSPPSQPGHPELDLSPGDGETVASRRSMRFCVLQIVSSLRASVIPRPRNLIWSTIAGVVLLIRSFGSLVGIVIVRAIPRPGDLVRVSSIIHVPVSVCRWWAMWPTRCCWMSMSSICILVSRCISTKPVCISVQTPFARIVVLSRCSSMVAVVAGVVVFGLRAPHGLFRGIVCDQIS
jgi:hypothetical protein